MSDNRQSLSDLAALTGATPPAAPAPAAADAPAATEAVETEVQAPVNFQPEAPLREQQLDKFGRAYATGRRKDAVARVWLKPGSGKIVVNVDKVAFTGNKRDEKTYYKHTGYAGGIKAITADKVLDGRFPERVLEKAVERMIPRGPLGRQQMRALHLYAGTEHPHAGNQPETLDVASLNRKNKAAK